ncbi:winged helix-turn-helix transcriptional regulator, partial [Leifsonia sp. 22587]
DPPPPVDVVEFQLERDELGALLGDGMPHLDVLAGGPELVDRFRRTFRFDTIPGEEVAPAASAA